MRKMWLAAILLGLLNWNSLSAQDSRVRYIHRAGNETWAANHPTLTPVAAITPPLPLNQLPPAVNYYLTPKNAPAPVVNAPPANATPINSAPAAIGAPVANHAAPGECHTGKCGSCATCGSKKCDWSRLLAWFCYRPLRGGCPKHGSCGCNCSTPLYLYFLHDCNEGRKFDLPAHCEGCKNRPGVAAQLVDGTKTLIHSAAPARSPKCGGGLLHSGSCAPTGSSCSSGCVECSGHRLFGQPAGHR